MYIQPNSTVRLLAGIPIVPAESQLQFQSIEAQVNYFASKSVLTKSNCQFVRTGVIQLEGNISTVYNVNYMMYQNSGFLDKWFYAFVNKIEYVNNNSFNVYFTIDVVQTWLFNYSVTGYIEREHVENDSSTAYLLPEPIDGGEMEVRSLVKMGVCTGGKILVIATRDGELLTPFNGDINGRVYSCFKGQSYTSATEINELLNSLKASDKISDKVIGIFAVPDNMEMSVNTKSVSLSRPSTVDGYTPKNLKVLSCLYNRCVVTNGQGSSVDMDYYDFSGNPTFLAVYSASAGVPEISLRPTNYNGSPDSMDKKMIINNFPQCPVTTTGFQEWISRQVGRIISVGSAIAGATGNIAGAIGLSLAGNIVSNSETQTYSNGTSSSCVDWSHGDLDFYGGQLCIKSQAAQKLDSYFDRFGYHVGRNGKPSMSRPQWNYIKMGTAQINGSLPSDDKNEIKTIYENGITFWKNPENVGNYSLNNK